MQAVAAIAFPAVFDACEAVVAGAAAAEGLTFLNCHGVGGGIGGAGEGAGISFVGAAKVGPIVDYLAYCWSRCCSRGCFA